jgi:DNA polymerase-3 subunit beta
MKFIVSSTALLRELQSVLGVLNSSNSLPILDNFLFEISEKKLRITCSDLETTMITELDVESKHSGTICVPAKLLVDTLKSLSDQPITFTIDEKTMLVEISSEYGKYKLAGHKGDEFPRTPVLEKPSKLNLRGDILGRAINKTIFATGNDDLRPVMCGVFCQFSADDVTFVATDAHKLVRYRRTDAQANKSSSFILPKKPVNLLKGMLAGAELDVEVSFNDTNASFQFANVTLICLLIDGKYPNYEAVIPATNPNKLTIDRSLFLSSIRRVSIFANKTTHQVRLKISGSELVISAEDLDFSNEANERLTCNYQGDDMEIGFNSKFLMEMLSNLEAKEVVLEMSAPNRAGILVPAEPEREHEDVLMLVMPVMLNG